MILAGQQAAGDWAPRNDAEAVGLRHGDQLALDAPVEEVVRRLLADEAVEVQFLGDPQRLDQLPGGIGGGADVAHLAGTDQVVQRAQRLVDRRVGAGAVDLVKVDVVGLQAAQAGFALFDDVAAAVAVRVGVIVVHHAVDLGRQHHLLALAVALEGLAGDFLAAPAAVDVGRIQEVDAGVERAVDDGIGVGGFCSAAEHHAAQAERTHLDRGPP